MDASTMTMLLNSDDSGSSSSSRDVFRVIAPDNIASLFGSASSARNSKPSSLNKPANTSATSDPRSDTAIDDDEGEKEIPLEIGISQVMRNGGFDVEMIDDGSMDAVEPNNWMSLSEAAGLTDEKAVVSYDSDGDYGDLTGSLDTAKLRLAKAAITMRESSPSPPRLSSFDEEASSPSRVFTYDPSEFDRPDRMQYGAYRRWKVPEMEQSTNTATRPTPRGKSRSGGSDGKRKKKKGFSSDSFYNAIKNLGSGPVDKGTVPGTGVAEPGKSMKSIQPKKAPIGKGRKKVITPGDIDSLFAKPIASTSSSSDADDDVDDDDDDLSDGPTAASRETSADKVGPLTSPPGNFNFLSPDEEIPKWLADADQAAKRKLKGGTKSRKRRRLTDDWRFWAAIIGTAGFVAAFVNIYQQTGGLGGGMGGQQGGEMLI